MKTEQLLFWLAVFGNLILLYYTIKTGFLAARLIGKGDRTGALRSTLVASALVGLTALFPWTLVAGEREIGKVALVICILTPFVVSMTKLWPSVKGRIPQAPMLAADVAIVGIVVGFAISGDWGVVLGRWHRHGGRLDRGAEDGRFGEGAVGASGRSVRLASQ